MTDSRRYYKEFYEWRAYADKVKFQVENNNYMKACQWEAEKRVGWILKALNNVMLVVDIGCAEGQFAREIARNKNCTVIGIDVSQMRVRDATAISKEESISNKTHFVLADAQHLPLKEESVDAVTCVETLEHVPDHEMTIKEIRRILMIEGTALILVPNAKPYVSKFFRTLFLPLRLLFRIVFKLKPWPDDIMGGHLRYLPDDILRKISETIPPDFEEHVREYDNITLESSLESFNFQKIRFLNIDSLHIMMLGYVSKFPKLIPIIDFANCIFRIISPLSTKYGDRLLVKCIK